MSINNILREAGRRQRTVKLTIINKSKGIEAIEVEPYSKREQGEETVLFCLDVTSFTYLNIPTSNIKSAETTSRPFKPRFPINL